MKKRIFYVINLDKNRIFVLLLFFMSFTGISFFSGFFLGKEKSESSFYSPESGKSFLNGSSNRIESFKSDIQLSPEEKAFSLEEDKPITHTNEKLPSEVAVNNSVSDSEKDRLDSEKIESKKRKNDSVKSDSRKSARTKEKNRRKNETKEKIAENDSPEKKKKTAKRSDKKITEKKSEKKINKEISKKDKEQGTKSKKEAKKDSGNSNPKSALLGSDDVNLSNLAPIKNKRSFAVQVGAFSDEKTASRMILQLKNDGFEAYIHKDKNHHRVWIGPSLSSQKANKIREELKNKNYASYLIKN